MSVLPIVQVGHPVLRQPARAVTREELASAEVQALIEAMRDTMRAAPGVGLAAPQVGRGLQLVVIEDAPANQASLTPAELARREREVVPFHVLVNPRLTVRADDLVHAYEGCLSFAGFSMVVPRARQVRVEAWDEHGRPVVKDATGWYARILQHEVDHLRGTVCIDRAETRTLTTGDNFVDHWSARGVAAARAVLGPGPDLTLAPPARDPQP